MKSTRWLVPLALGVAAALAVACSGGVSQADHDALKTQVAQEQAKVSTLQQQASAKVAEAAQLQQQVAAKEGDVKKAEAQLAAKQKEIEDLNKSMGALQGVTPLVYTKVQPTPTPRPTPTPPPAGYVPPTAVPPDDATVNTIFPFTFYVETLTGHQVSELVQYPSCVPNTQFKRGTHLVWRFEVFDTSTGKRVTNLDSPTMKVVLPDGKEVTARFSKRGGSGPWTWAAGWDVPKDYPLGAFDYQIVVKTKDGRTATFDQDAVALVNKTIGIDSRVQILD